MQSETGHTVVDRATSWPTDEGEAAVSRRCDAGDASNGGRWRIALLWFLVCLAGYQVNGRTLTEVDVYPSLYGAWSLVRDGSFEFQQHGERVSDYVGHSLVPLADGRWVSKYPPGTLVAALPVLGPVAAVTAEPISSGKLRSLGKLTGGLYVAGAVALFYLLTARLAPAGVLPATLVLAFGTTLYSVAGQALWSHGPATFGIMLGLYLLVSGEASARRGGLAGAAFGFAVATRPTVILFLGASLLAGLIRGRWRETVAAACVAGVCLGLMMLYNWHYFGSFISGGYRSEAGQWTTPWAEGLLGLTVAPSRGLLIYTPAVLLAPMGLYLWVRSPAWRQSALFWPVLLWSVAGLATVLLYAKWHSWRGGWSYGPRLLCEALPIFCLLVAVAYERLRDHAWLRRGAWGLVVLSVIVHVVGVFGQDGYVAWQERHVESHTLFQWQDTQIEAHARALLGLAEHTAAPPSEEH